MKMFVRSTSFPVSVYIASTSAGVGHAWVVKGEARENTLGYTFWCPPDHTRQKHFQTQGSVIMGHVPGDVRHFVSAPASDDTAQDGTLIFLSLGCKHFSALSKKLI